MSIIPFLFFFSSLFLFFSQPYLLGELHARRPTLSYSHLLQPPTPDGLGDSVVRARWLRTAALQLAASEREHDSDPGSPARRLRARHRSSRPRQLAPRRPRARRRPDAPARANSPVAVRWAHRSRRSRWKLRFFSSHPLSPLLSADIPRLRA